MRRNRRLIAVLACLSSSTCGGSTPSPTAPAPSPASQFASFQSAHFTFRYTPIDASSIGQTAQAIEAEFARITEDLSVTQMPTVVVTLYATGDALRQAVAPIVGPLPSFAVGLATGVDAIHILSPNLPATWAYNDALVSIVHEFAHCVSLRLNPSFGNNPRWLWESVALFEAGQYTDPQRLPYFRAGPLPSLAQLNGFDNTIIYEVGATFGLFIVETRGWDALRALIRGIGDLNRVLGTTERAFLDEWSLFVRNVFHISSP
jgi:hypothetical protein